MQVMEADGVQFGRQAYNTVMAAFAALEDWERVWAVMGAMRRKGLAVGVVSYNTLLSACWRCVFPGGSLRTLCKRASPCMRP